MEVENVANAVKEYFQKVIGKKGTTLGVEKTEKGWKVEFEAVDYPGAGFDPTLGLHNVELDEELNVISYKRTHLRKESQMEWGRATVE